MVSITLPSYKNAVALINSASLAVGDIIVRTKGGIASEHYAVFIGYQPHLGDDWYVAENQDNFGVRLITLQQFLNEGDLKRVRRFAGDPALVISRINNLLGKPYNIVSYNCEHFANEVTTGYAYSKQIQNIVIGAVLLSLLGLFVAIILKK